MPLAAAAAAAAASSSQAAIMSSFAQVKTNGIGPGGAHAAHVFSTEPTTGQQTLKSPVMECVTSMAMNRNPSPPRTLAAIPLSEMTPQFSELKAFAEEFKNKRIRLGFTQGAVGQSLADKGYSNFAQSTISRFEQMQLSPTNAAAIKLVLEKWLQETENPESVHSPSSSSPVMASRKRKRRAVFTPQTKTTLENYFKQNPRPNRHVIETVAQELDLLPEEVRVWFCNKRQKEKQGGPVSSSSAAVQMTAYKYPSYDRESSVSLSSSGANSPTSLYDFHQKRNSPSPPRNTTPFTIEELSKSSSVGTKTISSPMCIANPFASSPQGVVMALTTPRFSLAAQPTVGVAAPQAGIALPQLQIAQTTA
jgi:transcriptional regulator with XRE-family HTH domain